MQRFAEFIQHHLLLFALAGVLLAALAVDEALRRLRKFREVPPGEGVLLMNKGAAVVDLRAPGEFSAGHIINARNLPMAELDARVGELEKYREQGLLLCCQSGTDALKAAARLTKQGFAKLYVLKGGIAAWKQDQFPLERG
jgi:rhodanese-related sulfurtransferase